MINSVSWQDFILVLAALIAGYYFISILIFYSAEIKNIFQYGKSNLTNSQSSMDQADLVEPNHLMGGVRYESQERQNTPREEQVSIDSLVVAPVSETEESISISFEDSPEGKLVRTVSSLYDEIKSLIEIISSGSREECVTLFQTLLSNYPQLTGTESQRVINRFIFDECKKHGEFHFDLNEINSWWHGLK